MTISSRISKHVVNNTYFSKPPLAPQSKDDILTIGDATISGPISGSDIHPTPYRMLRLILVPHARNLEITY